MKPVFLAIIWKALAFALLFTFPHQAYSVITITDITGASRDEGVGNTVIATGIEVFAGAYGSSAATCGSVSSTEFCNTCDGTAKACNTTAVHQSLTLNISFQSDQLQNTTPPVNYFPVAYLRGTVNQVLNLENNAGALPIANDTIVTISIRWAEICGNWNDGTATADADCQLNASSNLGIGFTRVQNSINATDLVDSSESIRLLVQGDSDFGTTPVTPQTQNYCSNATEANSSQGACNFTVFPGDEKVFIEDVKVAGGFPSQGTDVSIFAVRVYYAEGTNFGSINVSSPSADLQVNSTSSNNTASMASNTVEGLKNDTPYVFKLATLDEANNVNFFSGFTTQDSDGSNVCFDGASIANCHQGTPESVIGLLEDDLDCFIATASFGSPFEKHVRDLRQFRTRYLHKSGLGRKLIKFYYQNSPPIARWIKQNPSVKPLVRFLLWPFWFFAKLCLQYGHFVFVGLLSLLLAYFAFRFSRLRVRA